MTADVPDLTVAELERLRKVTLDTYMGADESEYDKLPEHVQEFAAGDGGLVNMIDLAIHRTRQLEALRTQVQQDYAAIHAKQQRDHERILALEACVTAIAPGVVDQIRENADAIARARQRREEPNG